MIIFEQYEKDVAVRSQFWLSVFVMGCGLAGTVAALEVTIAPDRMLVVDGKRTFVIGLYEYPQDDAVLDAVARAGFNLIRAGADKPGLDKLQARGLYAWLNTGGRIELGPDREAGEARLREMVEQSASHPALLVWEVPDEALWNCMLGAFNGSPKTYIEKVDAFRKAADTVSAGMRAGYEVLKRLDPKHPVWINHAAGNSIEDLAAFGRAADIVGCDMYPVLPYATRPIDVSRNILALVGTSTLRMQLSAPGKPVWMVLQGAGWVDFDGLFGPKNPAGQRPTFEESRFMAYDVIVRGARGILYWGTHYTPKDSQLWRDLLRLARELSDLQPVLTAPDVAFPIHVESASFFILYPGSVHVLGKQTDAGILWLVVNESPLASQFTITGLAAIDGAKYSDPASGQELAVREGTLRHSIPALTVQILKPLSSSPKKDSSSAP